MAIDSKRKGKAGGARVITYTTLVNENTGEVWLIGYVFIDTLRRIPAKNPAGKDAGRILRYNTLMQTALT